MHMQAVRIVIISNIKYQNANIKMQKSLPAGRQENLIPRRNPRALQARGTRLLRRYFCKYDSSAGAL